VEVEMKIRGLMMDPMTNLPVVILKEASGNGILPIWVGVHEANAIALVRADDVYRVVPLAGAARSGNEGSLLSAMGEARAAAAIAVAELGRPGEAGESSTRADSTGIVIHKNASRAGGFGKTKERAT
jgi:hypothetical protein